jgi:hypothetical protein
MWQVRSKPLIHALITDHHRLQHVKEYFPAEGSPISKQSGSPAFFRDVALARRTVIHNRDKEPSKDQSTQGGVPICTVVFEIVEFEAMEDFEFFGDIIVHTGAPDYSSGNLRVAYERVYPCTAASHTAIALFRSNMSFCESPSYSSRILPIDDNRPPSACLPFEALRKVISWAALASDGTWRSSLFSYGLVCRSWSRVLNVFYSLYCHQTQDRPTAISVARSLAYRPENGKLITRLSPHDYRDVKLEDTEISAGEDIRVSQALLHILESATNIRQVSWCFTAIEKPLFGRLLHAFKNLRKVEKCTIIASKGDTKTSTKELTMGNIQHVLTKWTNLVELRIENCIGYVPLFSPDFFSSV